MHFRWFTADSLDGAELNEEGMANLRRMMGERDEHNGSNGRHEGKN